MSFEMKTPLRNEFNIIFFNAWKNQTQIGYSQAIPTRFCSLALGSEVLL